MKILPTHLVKKIKHHHFLLYNTIVEESHSAERAKVVPNAEPVKQTPTFKLSLCVGGVRGGATGRSSGGTAKGGTAAGYSEGGWL